MTRGVLGFAVAGVSLLGILLSAMAIVFLSLPDVKMMKKCLVTELYHVHLCSTGDQFTPFELISPHIINAVIMSEDGAFYSHPGIDVEEMKESLIRDFNEGKFARGASTITQQLVKNVFLSKDKTLLRKAEEIYLALQTEKSFTKKQILTYYLNVVEFGENIYGVKAACLHYFHKLPSEATPEQAAFLAFLLPNPKKYSQSFSHKKLTPFAAKMVKVILHRMNKAHHLTDSDYDLALENMRVDLWNGAPAGVGGAEGNAGADSSTGAGTSVEGQEGYPGTRDTESPTGIVPAPADASDENDQKDNEFQFDFTPEELK